MVHPLLNADRNSGAWIMNLRFTAQGFTLGHTTHLLAPLPLY